ncbi:MAG: hypothetical protein J5529_05405 [Prevotella sp.]|nr:hypothetical protein [Prevotella sp.]
MNKKIIFLAMALLCLANVTKAENVGIDDFTIKQGETIQVGIKLSNTHTNLTAFSMTLTLPEGLTLVDATPTARYGGSITIGMPDTDTYNICGIWMNGNSLGAISGFSGNLLILTLAASIDFDGGTGTLTDVDFITIDRQHVRPADISFTVQYERASDLFIGDANMDGEIDVSDVMTVVNKSLGKEVTPFNMGNADTNEDGIIDVIDVMNIVYLVLH